MTTLATAYPLPWRLPAHESRRSISMQLGALALVLVAFLVITPVAWLVMRNWLNDFAYRTDMSWWIFAASGGTMLFIAMVTLSIRTIRSASENPVNCLRSE